MSINNPTPPRWAQKLLGWFYRSDLREEIEGDLLEIFEKSVHQSSVRRARINYAWNVIRALRWSNLKRWNGLRLFDVRQDLKIAWRQIRFHRSLSFLKMFGFSLGLAPCILILLFIRYETSFDQGHPYGHNTFRVVQQTTYPEQTLYWSTTAYPLAAALRADFPDVHLVTQTAGPMTRTLAVAEADKQTLYEEQRILFVDSSFADVFKVDWLVGQKTRILKNKQDVAISDQIAQKYFGRSVNFDQIIGREIVIGDREPLVVVGIFEQASANQTLKYDLLISYDFFRDGNSYHANNWSGNHQGSTFMVLSEGSNAKAMEQRINTWKKKYLKPEDDHRISYFLQPLARMHNDTRYVNAPGSYVMPMKVIRVAFFALCFILIISILNFINLATAQASTRSKEVGVRKILGGSNFILARQFIVENILLVLIGTSLAVLVVFWTLEAVNQFFYKIELKLEFSLADWIYLGGIMLITILLATVYPAVKLAKNRPQEQLQPLALKFREPLWSFRKSLVLLQFVLVQLFVISAIIASRQMQLFDRADLGFDADAIVVTPAPDVKQLAPYRNQLLEDPGISEVAFGSGPPMNVEGLALGTTIRWPQQSMAYAQEAELKIGDPNYLDLYQMPLIAGRNFTSNKEAFDEFIVNEILVKALGLKPSEAIGRTIAINEGEATIVGVVADYHNHSLQNSISPSVLTNWLYFQDQAFIKLNHTTAAPLDLIESVWKQHFAGSIFRYSFLDQSIAKEYHLEKTIFVALRLCSFLVIGIACLGVFGMMMFVTQSRQKEISIRKVLGASTSHIIHLFSKQLFWVILVAFMVATPIVYLAAHHWLGNFVNRIELSPWLFVLGGIMTAIIALITSTYQTLHAALANPMDHLRD